MAYRRLIFALQGGEVGVRPALQPALADQVLLAFAKAGHRLADDFGLDQVSEQISAVAEVAGILVRESG